MFTATAKDDTAISTNNSTQNMKDNLHNAANQAGCKARSMVNAATDDISYASEKVTTEIRSNPVRSSVIVLGVGLLLGALLRR